MTDLNLISLCAMNTVAFSLPLSPSMYFPHLATRWQHRILQAARELCEVFSSFRSTKAHILLQESFLFFRRWPKKKDERWVYECRFTSLWAHCHFHGRRNWINVQQENELHNLFSFLAFLIWVSARTSSGEREWEAKNKNETNEMKWEKLRRWRSTKI